MESTSQNLPPGGRFCNSTNMQYTSFGRNLGGKKHMPLFEEFRETSQDMFGSDIQVYFPWDVCRNSSKSGFAFFVVVETIFFRKRFANKKHMPLFEEIRETSQGMFGSDIQVYFPWDVSRNSSKSGMLHFSKSSMLYFRKGKTPGFVIL